MSTVTDDKGVQRAAARRVKAALEQAFRTAQAHGLVLSVWDDDGAVGVWSPDGELLESTRTQKEEEGR